ncbi:hypothetical protein HYDPIDRAFT_40285 [Hydnomerulius pinastri MD-312]|uniref:Nickel/cobalt efflux system n=1 Tax=Hydnomerulius pinastri MD-312 TaxID=994086 RepID=A0A0C9VG29_9AGAM|nr:hypothetical protein HYDPIDRAFT_40285 [Hydnomerulius pinastri MD-312]
MKALGNSPTTSRTLPKFNNKLIFPSLTLFGRSLLLVVVEVLANAVCWAIAAQSHALLSLAILAWTIGLRHALDADHISAIDNATRTLISHGQLPVTCGLFFSLGHSTIVIVVNVAIVISTDVYNKLNGVGDVGSIIGTAVSGSFLFIVGLANSIILYKILRQRRRARRRADSEGGGDDSLSSDPTPNQNMLMMRLLGPLVNFVDRPWKMYPVGVLFGLGFDTASSIALLAISALAKESESGSRIPPAEVVILPLLFTTGMTLVDSLDSILMLYSYSGFADRSWRILESKSRVANSSDRDFADPGDEPAMSEPPPSEIQAAEPSQEKDVDEVGIRRLSDQSRTPGEENALAGDGKMGKDPTGDRIGTSVLGEDRADRMTRVKRNTMSNLSIILTTMSILLAFSISLIEIMGLVGDNCAKCQAAASAPDGGGLAGQWWRGWARANDNSGYIGAAVVGAFAVIVSGWYVARWGAGRIRERAVRMRQRDEVEPREGSGS